MCPGVRLFKMVRCPDCRIIHNICGRIVSLHDPEAQTSHTVLRLSHLIWLWTLINPNLERIAASIFRSTVNPTGLLSCQTGGSHILQPPVYTRMETLMSYQKYYIVCQRQKKHPVSDYRRTTFKVSNRVLI